MRRLLLLTLALGATLLPSRRATGQTAGPDPSTPGPVLHEYVPDEADLKALLDFSAKTGASKLPSRFKQQGNDLQKPKDGLSPRPAEPTIGKGGARRDRKTSMDRETTHDGTLRYHVVFDPSVVPFKRVSVLDAVDGSFGLYARDPRYREISLQKITSAPDRTFFWGSLLLRAHRGRRLPIPSVAPGMVIHGYETVPTGVRVSFYRDGADNFALSLSRTRRRVRLRLLVSAPTRYFSYQIPPGLTLADIPRARRPIVPPRVHTVAARMIARLGISESDPLKVVLDKLVAHFRAFEEGPLAISTGNTYADLTISQRGVCRHRSYAFVITAMALGLPARYVTNEAHAFVEVWVPRLGWIRVDLGGAASQMNVTGARGRTVHRPLEDPFPKPTSYSQGYTRLSGAVTGLTPAQRRGPQPRSGHGAIRRAQRGGGIVSSGSSSAAPTARRRKPGVAVLLTVGSARTTGLRGDPLTVLGTVSDGSGAPLAGRPVELLLRRPGSKDLVILGETVSGHDGRFKLVTTIPLAAQVGTYQVVAYSPADRRHQAGWSD